MPSGELENIVARNGNFLTVRRAWSGAGLYNSVSGDYLGGIGNGWLPEYSRNLNLKYDCACTPGGLCRTGLHGINLMRGWRNILYELLARGRVRPSKEICRVLGTVEAHHARDYGLVTSPMNDPAPAWNHSSI